MRSADEARPPVHSVGMKTHSNEADRLAALHRTGLLDTEPSESFDRVTRLAARTLAVPTVLVSLVDTTRQWFKSRYGCETQQTARDISFCTHTVSLRRPLIVPDAKLDVRFASSPLVTQPPHVRAYLGIPLFAPDGHAIGALCAMDSRPREFNSEDVAALSDFARITEDAIHALEAAPRADTITHRITEHELHTDAGQQLKQLQVVNDALRSHVKRLVESERAARASEERLRMITNGLPVMIGYWNRHLRCEFVNEGYRSWFGMPIEQMVGMTMPEMVGPDLLAKLDPYVKRVLEGHAQRFHLQSVQRPGDGANLSLEGRYLPDIDRSGEVRGFFSLVIDATAYQTR
jgi:PAS domain S-box-containing protein